MLQLTKALFGDQREFGPAAIGQCVLAVRAEGTDTACTHVEGLLLCPEGSSNLVMLSGLARHARTRERHEEHGACPRALQSCQRDSHKGE